MKWKGRFTLFSSSTLVSFWNLTWYWHSHWQGLCYPIHHRPMKNNERRISNWEKSNVKWKKSFHTFLLQEQGKPSNPNFLVTISHWHITPCPIHHRLTENGEWWINNLIAAERRSWASESVCWWHRNWPCYNVDVLRFTLLEALILTSACDWNGPPCSLVHCDSLLHIYKLLAPITSVTTP